MEVAAHSRQEQHEDEQLSYEAAVSAWVDAEGEIRTEDLDSPYGRQLWDTYHLIGDVLRTDELAIRPSELFYARISRAIDAEPAIVAPRSHRRPGMRMGLSGLAVAAAVASVVWVALPYFNGSGGSMAPTRVVASAADSSPDDSGLLDYLDAHRQIAGVSPVRQASFELEAAP